MKGAIVVAMTVVAMTAAAEEAQSTVAQGVDVRGDEGAGWMSSLRPVVEIEALAGQKHLSRGSFRALDEQQEVGLRATVARREEDVFGLTISHLESQASRQEEGFEIAARTRETGIGLRGRIQNGRFEATASAGVALLQTELAAAYAVRTWRAIERGPGLWYAIGVRAPVSSRVTSGVELRQTIGSVYGRNHSSRANGFHVGATIGVRFGKSSNSSTRSNVFGGRS